MLIGTDNFKVCLFDSTWHSLDTDNIKEFVCCLFHRSQSWHRQHQRVCVVYFTGHSPGSDNIKEFVLFISQVTVLAQTTSKSLCCLFHRSQSWHRQHQRVCVVYFTGRSPGTDNIIEFVLFISQVTVLAQTTSKSLCCLFHRSQSCHRQHQRVCVVYFTGHSPGTDNIKEFVLFISQVTVLAQTTSKSLCCLFHRSQSWHRQHHRVCVIYFTGHSPGTDNIKEFVCCLFHRSQSWHRQYQRVCVLFISQVTVLAQTISKSLCVVYFTGHSPGTDNIKEFVCCLFHRPQSWHRQYQRVCVLFISQVTVLAQTTSKSLCCLFHRSQSWHRQHQRVCVLFISQVTVLAQTTSKSLCVVYFTGHSPGTDNIKEFVCCLFHRSQSWHRQHQRVCVLFISQVTVLAQTTSKSFVLFISQVTVLAQTTSKSLCVVYFTGHSPGTDNIKEFVCCLFHRSQSWHRQYQRVCVLFISQVTVLAQTISKSLCVVYFTGHSPGTDNIKEFVLFISQVTVLAQTIAKSLCVVYFTGHSPGTDNIKEFVLFISQATVLAQTISKSLCVVYFTGHSPGTDNIKEFVLFFHRSQSWHRQHQRVCVLFISQVTILAQTISKSLCVVYFTGHSPGTDNIKEFVCCLFHRSQS